MSSDSFELKVITLESIMVQQEVSFAVVPTMAGPIGVLPGHAPLIGVVTTGILQYRDVDGKEHAAFVDEGFFVISSHGVTIVARNGETGSGIDGRRAHAARQRALEAIKAAGPGADIDWAHQALQRAETRIKIAEQAGR